MWDSPEGGELDLADDVRRRYLQEEFFHLSYIDRKKKKAVKVAAKLGPFTAGATQKGQFL